MLRAAVVGLRRGLPLRLHAARGLQACQLLLMAVLRCARWHGSSSAWVRQAAIVASCHESLPIAETLQIPGGSG